MAVLQAERPLVYNCPKCHKLNWSGSICNHKLIPDNTTTKKAETVNLTHREIRKDEISKFGISDNSDCITERELSVDGHKVKEYVYELMADKFEIFWVKADVGDMGVHEQYILPKGESDTVLMKKVYSLLRTQFRKHYRVR